MLVLLLLVATTAAFAVTEALKLQRSPVTAPRFDRLFSPTCVCETGTARLAFRLREPATIGAVIVGEDDDPVRTLARSARQREGPVAFEWDGRDDRGDVVPDGRYRLRIELEEDGRVIVIPTGVRVDTREPEVELVRIRSRGLSPDGDNRNDRLRIRYTATERSRPLVFVDGTAVFTGAIRPPGTSRVVWGGKRARRLTRLGAHTVWIRVQDAAGNLSEPTTPFRVRVRYIELARQVYRVREGGVLRFRVVTDGTYSWALLRRGARVSGGVETRRVVAVRLRAAHAFGPGRYILRVAARGRRDRAVVHVLPQRTPS